MIAFAVLHEKNKFEETKLVSFMLCCGEISLLI